MFQRHINRGLDRAAALLETTTINGKRHYKVPFGDEWATYPSITTVLSANPDKIAGLAKWRRRVGNKEASRIAGTAARRGTSLHNIIERYIENDPDFLAGEMPDAIAMFNRVKPILSKNLNNIIAQEAALFSHRLKIAGRVDCIAEWDGILSICDWKNSNKPKRLEWIDDYFQQACGYAAMYYEMTGIAIKQAVILVSVQDSEPQLFVAKTGDWLEPLYESITQFNKANA